MIFTARTLVALPVAAALLMACDAGTETEVPSGASRTARPEIWPQPQSAVEADTALEGAVTELMAAMTVEEKVGQTLQPQINSVTPDDVKTYHLGSVLNGGGGWPGNDKYAKPEDWLALADAFWQASMDTSDGGQAIPIIWGLDAVHGHNNVMGATLFPHNVGLGAANNPELLRRIGEVTAREVAVTGQDWDFGPTVAVARDSRWGRAYESYSEDPEIVAAYAAAMVEGLQGRPGTEGFLDESHLIATTKHFLGDGGTERGVAQGETSVSEEELRDIHAAGYGTSLAAGVQSVMASYNSWNGEKMHGRGDLLTGVLKERMGFDGLVVGDWNGHGQLPGCSNDSCAAAFNAGVDIFMVPDDWQGLYKNTLTQVQSGEISAERLDDAVRRILRVKMRAGLFERGKPSSRALGGKTELLGSEEHRAVARQAVRESLVLLKNNGGVLPLEPAKRILVAGDGANDVGKQCGGWTITWQGTGNEKSDFPGASSIWDGIREAVEAAGGHAVLSVDGTYTETPDAAIVVFGEDPYAEFQGDRDTIVYSPGDDSDLELLRRLRASGVPVVSVFITGRPLWVNRELNASDAFVVAWLPGTEGDGVSEVLFAAADGSVRDDFRGRLSFSWPQTPSQAVLNRHDPDYDPLFAYGYGLTYTDDSVAGEVGELSEDMAEQVAVSRTVYFDGGPVPPWRLYLGDDIDWRVPADTALTTTRNSENLVLRAVDRRVQEDARSARWAGTGMAGVYLTANEPLDLSREANGEMAMAFDAYVEQPPSGPFLLRLDSGDFGASGIDVSESLATLGAEEWGTVAVRLRCFGETGADMSHLVIPFSLATEGTAALRFSDVRLVPAEDSPSTCP